MAEFVESVNKVLSFNEYKILDGKWKISKEQAEKKALEEPLKLGPVEFLNSIQQAYRK